MTVNRHGRKGRNYLLVSFEICRYFPLGKRGDTFRWQYWVVSVKPSLVINSFGNWNHERIPVLRVSLHRPAVNSG